MVARVDCGTPFFSTVNTCHISLNTEQYYPQSKKLFRRSIWHVHKRHNSDGRKSMKIMLKIKMPAVGAFDHKQAE